MNEESYRKISKADNFKAAIEISQPQHPSIRESILQFYNDKLKELTGFDYNKSRQIYIDMDNMPGVYPDVCLMFYYLLKQYKPKKIVEFGSGFSTVLFSWLNRMVGGTLISYEQSEQYLLQTKQLLELHGQNPDQVYLVNMFPEENLVKDADFAFIDWHYRSWLLIQKAEWFKNCDIVVMDDSMSAGYSIAGTLYEFMNKTKRPCFLTYNGGGRTDMTEFISYKEELDPNPAYYLNQVLGYL